jgi:D-3-phosphoglycerate dehydrogenase
MKKCVVTDYTFASLDRERHLAEAAGATFEAHQCRTASDVADAVRGADVALVQFAPFTDAAAAAMTPGGTVVRYGVGYDNVDVAAARNHRIAVAYVPDYCVDEVADHTAALLLAMLRRLPVFDDSVRAGRWQAVKVAESLPAFGESTVGFLGFGRIGKAVKDRLAGFRFRFLAFDPFLSREAAAANGVESVSLDELLARSDALSLHAPLTDATRHVLGKAAFAKMKRTAVVVNSSRGNLVDESALADALATGVIRAAALDVFEREPLPFESPLRSAPNLILTPHVAWYSDGSLDRLQTLAGEEAARALRGEALRRPVPA